MGFGTTRVRVLWPHDTGIKPIPAGFTVNGADADFDGRFLQGDDETFTGSANGGGTHTHADTTNGGAGHNHLGDAHIHSVSAGVNTFTSNVGVNGGGFAGSHANHSHNASTSYITYITYDDANITLNDDTMTPLYVKATLLKPDDIGQDIPDDGVCFGDDADGAPDGYHICDGGGGTVDYGGRYVLGTNVGGDGGDLGGAMFHQHGGSTANHTHVADDHGHAAKICGSASATVSITVQDGTKSTAVSNHHDVTLTSKALADVSNETATVANTVNDPDYVKLLGLQNTSGGALTPAGVILPFVGAVADIPKPWILCDGTGDSNVDCRDKQIKFTGSVVSIGNTGGSNAHGHTIGAGHIHTHGAHNHSSTATLEKVARIGFGVWPLATANPHTHAWTIGNETPTMGVESHTLTVDDTVDGRAPYRTVVFVKLAPGNTTVRILGKTTILGKTKIAG